MAMMTIRSTYALDAETVRTLERLARRWRVSKSEALRRAIRVASGQPSGQPTEALDALDRLQRSLQLTPARARAWAAGARTERRASSRRLDPRGG